MISIGRDMFASRMCDKYAWTFIALAIPYCCVLVLCVPTKWPFIQEVSLDAALFITFHDAKACLSAPYPAPAKIFPLQMWLCGCALAAGSQSSALVLDQLHYLEIHCCGTQTHSRRKHIHAVEDVLYTQTQ